MLDAAYLGVTVTRSFPARTIITNLCLAAAASGCTSADTKNGLGPGEPIAAALTITPDNSTIAVGEIITLLARASTANGQPAPVQVDWSSDGGSIVALNDTTAQFSSTIAGSFTVRGGGASSPNPRDSASVVVTPLTSPIVSVSVSPTSVSLISGGTQVFSAIATRQDGTVLTPAVSWTATGGTVTSGGLYTAGNIAGTFRVIATQQAGSLADTSVVTVSGAPTGGANECATPAAGWIWCDDFEQNRTAQYFEYDNSAGQFVRTLGVGYRGSYGMRAAFSAGQISAGALHLAFGRTPQSYFRPVDAGTANYQEIYWRVYVRYQPGWIGGGGDKLTRATIFASSGTWAQAMIGHIWSGSAHDQEYLVMDPASGTDAAGNVVTTGYNDFANLRWLGIVRGSTPLFDAAHVGTWYCVETHIRLNTAGATNGYMEFWINDALEGRTPNLNWLGSYSGYGLNAIFLENYWNAGSPVAQERYLDRFVVSTTRIGC